MKILSIGNSFSQDSQRYLYGIAHAAGEDIYNVNLYIGGCSLERHCECIDTLEKSYTYFVRGADSGKKMNIRDALLREDWDVITLQEASKRSVNYENFEPYLTRLIGYVKRLCPRAKIALHKTWGYKNGTERIAALGYETHTDMYRAIDKAYAHAIEVHTPDIFLNVGEKIEKLVSEGYDMHRDDIHLSYTLGRYTAALIWFKTLFGRSVIGNKFRSFDLPFDEELVKLAQNIVG